jgi:hypothetical protein
MGKTAIGNGTSSFNNGSRSASKAASSSAAPAITSQAMCYMLLLAIQFGVQPILTKRYISETCHTSSCRSSVVLVQESLKFVVASSMLLLSGKHSVKAAVQDWSIGVWLAVAGVPSLLYCIQNLSALLAYQNLDPLTFNVLNQTKTLSAAFCCYMVMGRKQSRIQMISLVMLLLAALIMEGMIPLPDHLEIKRIVMGDTAGHFAPHHEESIIANVEEAAVTMSDKVSLGEKLGGFFKKLGKKPQEEERVLMADDMNAPDEDSTSSDNEGGFSFTETRHFTHGVVPVLIASFLSGLAGALSQKNLQVHNRNSYLFSMELCAASLIILTVSLSLSEDGKTLLKEGLFQGWTSTTIIPIFTNSIGGIVVGLVTKHAGSVRKGFALVFGIFLSGILQSHPLLTSSADVESSSSTSSVSKEQLVGGTLVAIALLMHCMNPYIQPRSKTTKLTQLTNGAANGYNNAATNGHVTNGEALNGTSTNGKATTTTNESFPKQKNKAKSASKRPRRSKKED